MKTTLLMTLALFALLVGNLNAQFSGGDGTENNPYKITSKKDLKELADSVANSPFNNPITHYNWSKNKYFILMNDINDTIMFSIGKLEEGGFEKAFQGNFDGNNKKIILALNTSTGILGLFSLIYNGIIENLIVDGYVNGIINVGGICGIAYYANISNCKNYGNVNGDVYTGGICGVAYYTNISNCKNYGNINGKNYVGGITSCLIALSDTSTKYSILYCENSGNVSGVFVVGGISGHIHDDAEYSYCINIGTIKGDSIVGGIAGGSDHDNLYFDSTGNIYNSVNSGLVIGKNIVGGIIGRCRGEIKNCLNTGVVKGNTKTGCIVGESQGGTIINCHYDKQICGGGE